MQNFGRQGDVSSMRAAPDVGQKMHLLASAHARMRAQQRGRRMRDFEVIVRIGTRTPDGYLVRDRDVDSLQSDLKRQIKMLEQLRGCYVVIQGNTVVSIYRASRAKAQRLLRAARARGGVFE